MPPTPVALDQVKANDEITLDSLPASIKPKPSQEVENAVETSEEIEECIEMPNVTGESMLFSETPPTFDPQTDIQTDQSNRQSEQVPTHNLTQHQTVQLKEAS